CAGSGRPVLPAPDLQPRGGRPGAVRATGGAIVLALALAVTYVPAAGASLSLSEREQKQALVFGQRSVINETFGGEWRVEQGSGDSVEGVTPVHPVAP